ncbi:MAG: thiamine-phosphate kinase [Gammaproteobacteria bacterium]|nr:thiamine-phosphate kinase [Gammaproteobacteria bacterium]
MPVTSEFSLIKHFFSQLTSQRDDVILGIGDDCALLQCPGDQVIAVSIDTLVEGIHFFSDVEPVKLGHKSLAVGLSDLAAMGATPAWFTLALTLPEVDHAWLKGFSKGLAKLATEHNIQLVGGDTTRGPLCISIQVHGFVKPDQALQRDGAKIGDLIYVTGTLGDAGAALQYQSKQWHNAKLTAPDKNYLQQRLETPTPRVAIGQKLLGIASSAIDVSDGLLADLGHILERSNVGARLDLAKLPLSCVLSEIDRETAQQFALHSGDDYELCFTVASHDSADIEQDLAGLCTCIGTITNDNGIYFINHQNQLTQLTGTGYDHFSANR